MLSVIIPTFRPQEYFLGCLESLEKQTIERVCFEIIVVLNGEKEPYLSDIHRNIKKTGLDNIQIIYTEETGVSNARNIGLDHSKGDYIVFLDDDDFVSENYLSGLYGRITGRKDSIVVSNVRTYDPVTHQEGLDYLSRAFSKNKEGRFSVWRHRSFFSSVCAKIIPVSVIEDIRFKTKLSVSEDALFMFTISKNITQVFSSDRESIYFRRLTANSASRKKRSFTSNLKVMCCANHNYSKIYFSDIKRYRFIFYLNRIVATIYTFIRRVILMEDERHVTRLQFFYTHDTSTKNDINHHTNL